MEEERKFRKDFEELTKVKEYLLEKYSWITDIWFNPYEDYDIDLWITGFTRGKEVHFPMEVKSLTQHPYSSDYWTTGSTFGNQWRYGLTGGTPTQEEITKDRVSRPELPESKYTVINARTLGGNIGKGKRMAKLPKLLKEKSGLIYLFRDGLVIISPRQLKKAIKGYGWLKCGRNKEYGGNFDKTWQLKGIVDLSKGKFHKKILI